jgi:hypothetical protein
VARPGVGGGWRAAWSTINGVRSFACVVTRRAARAWASRRRRARGGDAVQAQGDGASGEGGMRQWRAARRAAWPRGARARVSRHGRVKCVCVLVGGPGHARRVRRGQGGGAAALQRRGGKVGWGMRVKEGGGRRLARRRAARGRTCGSQAGGRRGKEERKGRKKKREKKERGKRKEMGERERDKERARKRKGKGIASALIAERRSRVVDRPPSGAGWDGDEGKEGTDIAKGGWADSWSRASERRRIRERIRV